MADVVVDLLNLAASYRETGEISKSTGLLEELIVKSPGHPEALFWLSQQAFLAPDSPGCLQLEHWNKYGGPDSPDECAYIFYALARVRENQCRWSEAFDFYEKANKSRKTALKLFTTDSKIYIGQSRLHKSLYKKLKVVSPMVLGSELGRDLVFIVGLPRSGSTLLETIMSMDRNVQPLGETSALSLAVEEVKLIQALQEEPVEISILNKRLLLIDDFYRRTISSTAQIKIDKCLVNFYFLGLISRVWPAAKIVHIHRNPLDQIISAWRSRFIKGHHYSLDLNDLVRVYISYKSLMTFWEKELRPKIYHCQYERLVSDSENEIKSLANFCQIEWSEDLLKPHQSKRVVKTASFQQVRSPINSRSIGFWKNYQSQLEPIVMELEAAGIHVEF